MKTFSTNKTLKMSACSFQMDITASINRMPNIACRIVPFGKILSCLFEILNRCTGSVVQVLPQKENTVPFLCTLTSRLFVYFNWKRVLCAAATRTTGIAKNNLATENILQVKRTLFK